MSPENPSPRLLHLLSRLSDGLLESAEAGELDRILLRDAGARAYYRCHTAVHLALAGAGEAGKVADFPAVRNARRWPAFAAAAALILAAGTAWWSWHRGPEDGPPVAGRETEGPVLAVTSAVENVSWSLPREPAGGERLGVGLVRVFTGDLAFSLVGGRTVHVRGPAEFELLKDGEFALRRGRAAFRTIGSGGPFIVHLPKGALVDMGSDFSAEVDSDGTAEVRVFERELTASTIGSSGRTKEELQLQAGRSILVNSQLSPGNRLASDFLRVPPAPLSVSPGSEKAYSTAVLASSPAAYWRFETIDSARRVADETGKHPLQLMERARLSGNDRQRYLFTDGGNASGFALAPDGIPGLDTARGTTVECLLFSSTENYGTAFAFELADPGPRPPGTPRNINHAPQTFALERMGRKGEHIGHIHPDFALRALFRSPAGYFGGTNLYSSESHLIHRWIHVVAVRDGTRIQLYLDGTLSDVTEAAPPFLNASLRPIIGRLQPNPADELRQWVGGIDEVALYGRPLSASEIRAHAAALKP